MIIDYLENVKYYRGLTERIKKAFEFLEEIDFKDIEPGRYNIEGDEIFALVQEYETKSIDIATPEAHERYLDIQYMVDGNEKMGYAPLEDQDINTPYSAEKDVVLYNTNTDTFILKEDMFAVFFPTDIHAPGIMTGNSPQKVKKVVVKVLL